MPRMTERKWHFALLGNRIAYALEQCELGPAEIARRVGVSRPAAARKTKVCLTSRAKDALLPSPINAARTGPRDRIVPG